MGSWILEVCKMGMYITFPVGLFYMFNQPAYFEEWVTKTKRELYPPDNEAHREMLQSAIREVRGKHDEKIFEELNKIKSKETK